MLMGDLINSNYLIVLKRTEKHNGPFIELGKINIKRRFEEKENQLKNLCNKEATTIEEIAQFLNDDELQILNGTYSYCNNLSSAFNEQTRIDLSCLKIKIKDLEATKSKEQNNIKVIEEDEIEKLTKRTKETLPSKFAHWLMIFDIESAYRECEKEKNILAFSHRYIGWSNPIIQLNENFAMQVLTNFGYGRSSYFAVSFKFKGIEIAPFSKWIDYRYADIYEILRFASSYPLDEIFWDDAFKYALDTCNLAISDEHEFIEKYIVNECKYLVNGLAKILDTKIFALKYDYKYDYKYDKEMYSKKYTIELKGIDLIEYRANKISGALNFIEKLNEFEDLFEVMSLIEQIEKMNIQMGEIIKHELPIEENNIQILNMEIAKLQIEFDEIVVKYSDIIKNLSKVENKEEPFVARDRFDVDYNVYRKAPEEENLEYNNKWMEFYNLHKEYKERYSTLKKSIDERKESIENIKMYSDVITKYFEKEL